MSPSELTDTKEVPPSAITEANTLPKSSEQKPFDPFAPPYNENLYLGELKDEEFGEEYVVIVRLLMLSRARFNR